ncbi:MAG TPA: tryptophan 2,3-dioxygenase family protein [Candidatus Binatia bacterium]|nr:tryptophan 2,3-dioxygenase family protein [Candidatus Binatia bacterium]
MAAHDKTLTYGSYLRLDELLALQQPRSTGPEHDEMLFIVVHQVYELWFKQVLHELRALRTALDAGSSSRSLAALKRVLTILKTLVAQVDVIETMTPVSFNSFRARLEAASGFQSAQFREIETLLGHKRPQVLDAHPAGSPARARLEALLAEPSVFDAFLRYLERCGYAVPPGVLARDVRQALEPSAAVQELLLEAYRRDDFAAQLCERLVDLDEGLQEWRYRHVKMVERTIGAKIGTGGSAGAAYLRQTLFRPLFPDLWEIRSRL